MFFAEPRRCDLEQLLMPYLAAMSAKTSCPSPSSMASASANASSQRCASSAPAAAAATVRVAPSATMQKPQQCQKNEPELLGGAAPSSPRPALPRRPAMEKKVKEDSSPPSSQAAIVLHHLSPSASTGGAHVFSVDLPGRSMSSFDISVEERDGMGRLFIDATAIEGETEKAIVPRKALALSLDLPRDADLSAVSADYEAGVLLVRVPLIKEEAPKRFKVVVGGGGKEKKEETEKKVEAASAKASPPPSPSSLGAVAAADLARVSLQQQKKKKDDDAGDDDNDDEDGSWKAVSSDDKEEDSNDGDEGDKKLSRPSSSSPASASKRKSKEKAPSGGAVLEAIEDADA